ncbi:hypothetical protein Fmac_022302 [Flemingia macrophylla]|uniref:Uncharacterized protein n=1 Tax=Flemingia macrophylla TaxID=520843 RepID=A0ABD1LZB7_9FABA
MAIPKGTTTRGLASIVVIMALILSKTAAHGPITSNVTIPIKQMEHTVRVDPYDNLEKYRGGFDITNVHYWTSVFFTGIFGYAIGGLWFLLGILCGLLCVINKFCCKSDGGANTRKCLPCICNYKTCNFSPIPLAISLIILIMVASVVVYVGSANFYYETRTSVKVIIKIADDASELIHNATTAIEHIQVALVGSGISEDISTKINSTAAKLENAVDNIVDITTKNRGTLNKAFRVVLLITIVIVSLNLVAVPFLSVFGVKMFWKPFYLLVILCWLMTALCWLICGFYFFLANFSNDTCIVLSNFEENPYNNSLTSILPCNELRSAKSILHEVGARFSTLVNKVNAHLGNLFPNHVTLCNPFTGPPEYSYQLEHCPPTSIQVGDIPKVLEPYTCFDDEKCSSEDLLVGSQYRLIESYAIPIQTLLNMIPSMEQLIGCRLVKDAFSEVLHEHCKPLTKSAGMTWVGMVFLAAIMVFLIVLWTIKASQDHSYHPSDSLV